MTLLLLDSTLFLCPLQMLLKVVDLDAQDNIGIHLNKASVAVKGKAAVTRLLGQSLHCDVVQSQVEHCVHHSCRMIQSKESLMMFDVKTERERIKIMSIQSHSKPSSSSRSCSFPLKTLNIIQLPALSVLAWMRVLQSALTPEVDWWSHRIYVQCGSRPNSKPSPPENIRMSC